MKKNNFVSRLKASIKSIVKKIVFKEIYVEGREPPKSFAFKKKFLGIYFLFLFYSFVLLIGINFPSNIFIYVVTFGNPFVFGNAIIALFLCLSILYSNNKLRLFIFQAHSVIKQAILYIGLIFLFYFVFLILSNANLMSYLLGLATFWLILLSIRFFMYSRKFATKIEARVIEKYSLIRRTGAFITPYFILAVLVFLALIYRGFLVFISLDLFALSDPVSAVSVYNIEMRLIMPLIYFSLILTLLFIIFEFVFTRKKAETRRAALYDNFTFGLIILFIFFFQILQVTIFLFLSPETVNAIKATLGTSGSPAGYVFVIEFLISMFFLYRIIKKFGKSIGWQLLFFKRDGLVTLILGCVFAQTLSRFSLQNLIPNQSITLIGNFFMADKYVVSILMIIFLGLTLLIYYLKPHETSMFIRLQKETVDKEAETMDIIYKLLKSEYIRRADAYPIEILERELIKATKLPKSEIYSIVQTLSDTNMDLLLTEKKSEYGKTQKIIDFVSVTEKFDSKTVAEKKAKSFLSQRLYKTISSKKPKQLNLVKNAKSEKASDQFLSSLAIDITKKHQDEVKNKIKQKKAEISFITKDVPESLKDTIVSILKKEYIYRIENEEKYPEFNFPISEIASEVQLETRINPGELYPILTSLDQTDIELRLLENSEEPEDKIISFLPLVDDDLNYVLSSFRPDYYSQIKVEIINLFIKYLKRKRVKATLSKIKKCIPNENEMQKQWNLIYRILIDYFPHYEESIKTERRGGDISKILKKFPRKDVDVFNIES
ncbi:MAG: hypothetical protein ACFFD1_06215 [Candidatus Thorarchaeota archaeon]